jgi:hypothetical protein
MLPRDTDLITITDRFVLSTNDLYHTVPLWGGKTYLMHKNPLNRIVEQGLGERAKGHETLPHLPKTELRPHATPVKVLFLFDGGLGDAISLAVLLDALKTDFNILSNVACKYEIWQNILWPLGFRGKWFQVPIALENIQVHDYIQTRADQFFHSQTEKWNLSIINELAESYGFDLNNHLIHYTIPKLIVKRTALPPTSKIRIGVSLDSKGLIRSYPPTLQPVLIQYLLESGFEVFLFGRHKPSIRGLEHHSLKDYCGQTTIMELAALIRQMDMVLCMDSFIAHFSNILGVKTLVLLSVTRKGIYDRHKHVTCLESQIPCTPCGEVGNKCPKRFSQCRAFFHESITPESIVHEILRQSTQHLKAIIAESLYKTVLSG